MIQYANLSPALIFSPYSVHAVQVVLPVRLRGDGGHARLGLPRRALQLRRLHRLLHHDHRIHLSGKEEAKFLTTSAVMTPILKESFL